MKTSYCSSAYKLSTLGTEANFPSQLSYTYLWEESCGIYWLLHSPLEDDAGQI